MKSDLAKQNSVSSASAKQDSASSASAAPAARTGTGPTPSEFYDDLDELGNDRRLPPSLKRSFQYEPDIISERLVQLQQFIQEQRPSVQHCLDRSIDAMFYTERRLLDATHWLAHDAPALVWPTTQVAAISLLGYLANRHHPLSRRLASPLSLALMTGFLVYPAWRREAARLTNQHLLAPVPALDRLALTSRRIYWEHIVGSGVDLWNAYDAGVCQIRRTLSECRQRVRDFFRPPPRRSP